MGTVNFTINAPTNQNTSANADGATRVIIERTQEDMSRNFQALYAQIDMLRTAIEGVNNRLLGVQNGLQQFYDVMVTGQQQQFGPTDQMPSMPMGRQPSAQEQPPPPPPPPFSAGASAGSGR